MNQLRDVLFPAPLPPDGLQWTLRRNCSFSPGRLAGVYAALCGVSLGVAAFFWLLGATLVMPFALVELLAVGAAFLFYARHAADSERIHVSPDRLVVEQERAGSVRRREFARAWVRVESDLDDGGLVVIRGGGQTVRVGRHLRAELRPELARQIDRGLQRTGWAV